MKSVVHLFNNSMAAFHTLTTTEIIQGICYDKLNDMAPKYSDTLLLNEKNISDVNN